MVSKDRRSSEQIRAEKTKKARMKIRSPGLAKA
jgi:hypothetical protein